MYRLYQDSVTILIEHFRIEAGHLQESFGEDYSEDILRDRLGSFMGVYDELIKVIDSELLHLSNVSRKVNFLELYIRKSQPHNCIGDIDSLVEKDIDKLERLYIGRFEGVKYDKNLYASIWNLLEQSELDSAVRKSFVILSGKLRERYKIAKGTDGEALVNKVYGQKGESKLEGNERDSLRNILNGMYGLFRNDYMHNDNDGDEAMSIIHMINTILLKIDKLEDI